MSDKLSGVGNVSAVLYEATGVGRKKRPPTRTIRVQVDIPDLVAKAARMHNRDAPEYLSELLRPLLRRELLKAMDQEKRRLSKEDE